MDNHETPTAERKPNETLRFTDGRVSGDRRMQTQRSVERALKQAGRFDKASGHKTSSGFRLTTNANHRRFPHP